MTRSRLALLVVCLMLGAFLTAASSANQGGEVTVIRPWTSDLCVTQAQRVIAKAAAYINCSQGIDLDWRNATTIHLELWRDGNLIQVVETRDARWDSSPVGAEPACLHVNSPYYSRWEFQNLRLDKVGNYELHWTVRTTADLTDGGDWLDGGDGALDIYPAGSLDKDTVTNIRVVSPASNCE